MADQQLPPPSPHGDDESHYSEVELEFARLVRSHQQLLQQQQQMQQMQQMQLQQMQMQLQLQAQGQGNGYNVMGGSQPPGVTPFMQQRLTLLTGGQYGPHNPPPPPPGPPPFAAQAQYTQHHSGVSGQYNLPPRAGNRQEKPRPPVKMGDPCCVCGSTMHQLGGHPNPNTPYGFLKGGPLCNTLDHSLARCGFLNKASLYHYLRVRREGRCPLEFHGDFREIPNPKPTNGRPAVALEHMPLTPEYALANQYANERDFRPPGRSGGSTLKQDPFWTTDRAWGNLGQFGFSRARVSNRDRQLWDRRTQTRHQEIRQTLGLPGPQQAHVKPEPGVKLEQGMKPEPEDEPDWRDIPKYGSPALLKVEKEEDDDENMSDIRPPQSFSSGTRKCSATSRRVDACPNCGQRHSSRQCPKRSEKSKQTRVANDKDSSHRGPYRRDDPRDDRGGQGMSSGHAQGHGSH